MYNFKYYTETDDELLFNFMQQNSFAILSGVGNNMAVATQIPFQITKDAEGKIILSGHMMRKTDHHLAFEKNDQALVIFTGPHCYISASWYTNPQMASTWNYMSIHARGALKFTDEIGTIDAIKKLTEQYEGKESAGSFSQMPDGYVEAMVKAIVGFTIEVQSLQNIFKLSQNRDLISQQNIIKQLFQKGDHQSVAIAKEMQSRL